ncbi:slipin family protein [Synergistaceae bacterium OttesenSCG-928-D05]|nr:slipin family protein [Synergistaceae bacterium OttesenSCG-928-D05]
MKVVINESERGFLFKNGRFIKMLQPGRHLMNPFGGAEVRKVCIDDAPMTEPLVFASYMEDKDFQQSVAVVPVREGTIALHYRDGAFADVLRAGRYAFWSLFSEHKFHVCDMSDDKALEQIPADVLERLPDSLVTRVLVADTETVLMYRNGSFLQKLPPGRHYFWRNGQDLSFFRYDTRVQQLELHWQEILTKDKVALRINFVASYRITDAIKLHAGIANYEEQLYVALQMAVRDLTAGMTLDELMEKKERVAGDVLALLKTREEEFYVTFLFAGLKDIILPGEVREIMNTVLIAEKKAQANVIARREEVASTRSLLNTAKLMEENTTLYKLKELEYLERICDKVGSISVTNASGLLEQLGAVINGGARQ